MDKGGYEEALRYLVARQMDVYVIQILSLEEIEPEITGDLQLVDIEDGDLAEITVNGPLLRRYQQNLAAYRAALYDFCTRRGVTCLFTSNQVPFDRLVLTYLRQRGLVRPYSTKPSMRVLATGLLPGLMEMVALPVRERRSAISWPPITFVPDEPLMLIFA
jgi:hypothetical protein